MTDETADPEELLVSKLDPNTFVGFATDLRQNMSKYMSKVTEGERLLVTDRNKPVAMLAPPPTTGPKLDRMIAAGLVHPPRSATHPDPLPSDGSGRFSMR